VNDRRNLNILLTSSKKRRKRGCQHEAAAPSAELPARGQLPEDDGLTLPQETDEPGPPFEKEPRRNDASGAVVVPGLKAEFVALSVASGRRTSKP
jgi:hypothetical protein